MAAASLKEKNMPAISANIYCGLQKWVNRASISLHGGRQRRGRFNSDLSNMTMYKRKSFENVAKQNETQARIVPVHGRSRSSPISMPESLTFEGDYQKIPKVPTSRRAASNGTSSRKQSSELSDDSSTSRGSYKDKSMSVLNQRLSQNLSKSESCLVDANRGNDGQYKSHTAPNSGRRRKSSDTNGSLDSNSSELDINNNRKRRASRSLSKTNKPDRSHSVESKVDFMGANRSELSPRNLELKSKEIHSRLDKWIEKSSAFQDSRQSSLESTSSSDDTFYSDSTRLNETQHFRDLQTAIHDLVSSCGQPSVKNSTNATNGETVETNPKRKISLKDAGQMFCKTIEIDTHYFEDEQDGSPSPTNSPKDSQWDERKEYCLHEESNGIRNSSDNVEDCVKERDEMDSSGEVANHNNNYVSDIGRLSKNTRATNVLHNHALHDARTINTTCDNSCDDSMDVKIPNGQHQEIQNTNSQPDYSSSSSDEHKSASPFSGRKNGIVDMLGMTAKSPQASHPSSPPRKGSESDESTSQTDTKIPAFNDDDLTAFALECVQHASKKKSSIEKTDSKSDSDEERSKVTDLDFVYIPRNREASFLKTVVSDDKALVRDALSDDDACSSTTPRQLRDATGSTDSLDGFVLFEMPVKDIDFEEIKSHSSNENESSKGQEKTDYTKNGNLRKFPSMPLFYVPKSKDSDGSSEVKPVKSLGKSLWKRIKSIPRASENRTQVNQKAKQSQSNERMDPFYHGDKEAGQAVSKMRPKSHSMGSKTSNRRRRRLSLDQQQFTKPLVTVTQPSEDHTQEDDLKSVKKTTHESQC